MITSYKGRSIEQGKRYEVYRNLHKQTFSILDPQTRLVVGHGDEFIMTDVEYVVRQGGKKKAIETGVRNVHAVMLGQIHTEVDITTLKIRDQVTYNPFIQTGFFYSSGNMEEITHSDKVYVKRTQVFELKE